MTIEELLRKCNLCVATTKKLKTCEPFDCDNEDLNDFFANDVVPFRKRLLGKTYFFCDKENPNTIVSAFTLSNDSIRITSKLPEEDKSFFLKDTELDQKNLRRYPAVLIGRLGTSKISRAKAMALQLWTLLNCGFALRTKQVAASSLLMLIIIREQYTITRRMASNSLLQMNASRLNTWE